MSKEKPELNLKSKIEVLEAENAALSESAEDTLLYGSAAEIIYRTENSAELINQVLERISILKNIPFCACMLQSAIGFEVEDFYASFADIRKSDVQISISSSCIEKHFDKGFLILNEGEFESAGFYFRVQNLQFVQTCALIIPCYSKSIPNRFFVFLDEGNLVSRFRRLHILLHQIVHLAAERIEKIFIFGVLTELNSELDQRVKSRTEELTEANNALKREIRERKTIETALRVHEQKLLSVYNAAIDIAFIAVDLSADIIIQSFSPGAEKMFEIPAIEVLGKPLGFFQPPEQKIIFPGIKNDLDEIGWSRKKEIILCRSTGEYFTAMLTVYPLYDDESNHTGALAVCVDISELKQTQDELIMAREKAEESDRLKTAFLQNMSHEIRTPLNGILGFADLLPEFFDDREKLSSFANIIKQRGKDLLEIINDILHFARIESGQMILKAEDCNLGDLFTEIKTLFYGYQNRFNNPNVSFHLRVDDSVEALNILIDKPKLKQILINLVGNAFKFTQSGKIVLGCSIENQNELQFFVSDTGIGIPIEKHKEIFSRFTQVSNDNSQIYGGTGLGLAIVTGLLNLMGGRIWLESESGKGSTFYFTIPVNLKSRSVKKAIAEPKVEKQLTHRLTKILIIDDGFNAIYIREILSDADFEFFETRNRKQAVEICGSQNIDLVIMDFRHIEMPFQFIRQLRQQNPDIRIIVQTAYATAEDKEKAIEFGCDDYLSKPIKRELLLSRINHHLKLQQGSANFSKD